MFHVKPCTPEPGTSLPTGWLTVQIRDQAGESSFNAASGTRVCGRDHVLGGIAGTPSSQLLISPGAPTCVHRVAVYEEVGLCQAARHRWAVPDGQCLVSFRGWDPRRQSCGFAAAANVSRETLSPLKPGFVNSTVPQSGQSLGRADWPQLYHSNDGGERALPCRRPPRTQSATPHPRRARSRQGSPAATSHYGSDEQQTKSNRPSCSPGKPTPAKTENAGRSRQQARETRK